MTSNPTARGRLFWGAMMILLGTLLLLDQLDYLDFGSVVSNYWPLILVLIGARMILFPSRRDAETATLPPAEVMPPPAIPGPSLTSEFMSENRFIGDIDLRVQSEDFKGGSASTFIGDLRFDLSQVTIKGGDRYLTLSGFIGDAMIILPKNLAYSVQASALIGDFKVLGRKDEGFGLNKTYKSADYDTAPARLNIRISYFIGDVTIQ